MTPILSVSEFVVLLNRYFAELGEFAVEGEILSLKVSKNQALFIDLKDVNDNALLKLANYAPRVSGLNQVQEGMKVVVYGSMSMYGPTGGINFQVRKIEPQGEGALKLAFERLKQILESEGLFAPERKRALPLPIKKIALITAANSAALADFCKILQENHSGIEIDFYPVAVQGQNAEAEIMAALEQANQSSAQLISLIRGGGSLEDLRAFNAESVVRKIASSKLPVLVGVGHEVDISIADLVADLRASTPSQAAYYLCVQNQQFLQQWQQKLEDCSVKLVDAMPNLQLLERLLQGAEQRLLLHLPNPQTLVFSQTLLNQGLLKIQQQLEKFALKLECTTAFEQSLTRTITSQNNQLFAAEKLFIAYSPEKVLARGFALVQTKQGKYISSSKQLAAGDRVDLRFADGSNKAEILE